MYRTPPPKEATEPATKEESPDSLLLTPESKASSGNAPTAMVDKSDPTVGKLPPTTVPVPLKAVALPGAASNDADVLVPALKSAGVTEPKAADVRAPNLKSADVPKVIFPSSNVTEGEETELSVASSGNRDGLNMDRLQAFAARRRRIHLNTLTALEKEGREKLYNIEQNGIETKAIAESNALGIDRNYEELQKLRKLHEQQLHESKIAMQELKIANMASDRTKYKEALVLIQRYERQFAILNKKIKRLEALEAAQPLKDRSNGPPLPPQGAASSGKVDTVGGARAGKAVKTHIGLRSTTVKQAAQKTKKERSSTVVVKSPPP